MPSILYDHSIFTSQIYGGISRYFTELIRTVAVDPRARVFLFMGLHWNQYGLEKRRGTFAGFMGWRRPQIKRTTRLSMWIGDRLLPGRFRAWKPDIYHPTNYRLCYPQHSAKLVLTVHDMVYERMPERMPGSSEVIGTKRKCILDADGIICISENTRSDLLQFFPALRPERVAVIHHANSLTVPASPVSVLAERPYLLYVGARSSYKGFMTLLRAYGRSSRLHRELDLVCFGGAPLQRDELEEAQRTGVLDHLRMLRGDDICLATLYAHATAFIFPSIYEGFGLPLLEAMHYDCPVVAARASCFPEIAGEAALYFAPDDPDDLATKLECLLDDTELRTRLINAGKVRRMNFSWEKTARETVDFYSRIAVI